MPGQLARRGLGEAAVRAVNPRIVYCSLSGYGQAGPYRDRPGHDLDYLAIGGLLALLGPAGARPVPPGLQVADMAGGTLAALEIVAALFRRERTGEGAVLDVAVLDAIVAWLGTLGAGVATAGVVPGPLAGTFPCYAVYPAADGAFLALGALEPPFWVAFCRATDRDDLVPRQFDPTAIADVAAILASRPRAELARGPRRRHVHRPGQHARRGRGRPPRPGPRAWSSARATPPTWCRRSARRPATVTSRAPGLGRRHARRAGRRRLRRERGASSLEEPASWLGSATAEATPGPPASAAAWVPWHLARAGEEPRRTRERIVRSATGGPRSPVRRGRASRADPAPSPQRRRSPTSPGSPGWACSPVDDACPEVAPERRVEPIRAHREQQHPRASRATQPAPARRT